MIQTIRNAFTIPDLRRKLLYTMLIVFIFRIGTAIPVPFILRHGLRYVEQYEIVKRLEALEAAQKAKGDS